MKNKKLILALVLPLLTSGLLISCKPKGDKTSETLSSQSAVQSPANLAEDNQNIEELQKTLTDAETSLDNIEKNIILLNSNLQKFVTTEDEEEKNKIKNSIDFKTTTDSWDQFKQSWENLKDQIDKESRVKSSLNEGINFERNENDFITELDQKITDFDKIIKLLDQLIIKEDKDIIEQLQKQLEMKPSENGKFKRYGIFGEITQGKLQDKTTNRITEIKDDLEKIKKPIYDLLNTSDVSELKNKIEQLNKQIAQEKQNNTLLNQKNKTLENEKQLLTEQMNDINKKFIITVVVLLGLLTVSTGIFVLLLMSNKGKIFSNLGSKRRKNDLINELENPNYPHENNTFSKNKVATYNYPNEQNTVLKLENYIKQLVEEINKLDRELESLKQTNKQQEITINKLSQEKMYSKNQTPSNFVSPQTSSHANNGSLGISLSKQSGLATQTATITNTKDLLDIYNNNKLLKYDNRLISVSTESTSIESSRTGSGKNSILTQQSPSKYWIVEIGRDLYLVPKENALNTNDMTSVEVLFQCWGYKKDVSNPKNFSLIKPGKVREINGQWELVECGTLNYH